VVDIFVFNPLGPWSSTIQQSPSPKQPRHVKVANWNDLVSEGCEKKSSPSLQNGLQITTVQSILYGFDGRNTDSSNEAYVFVFDTAITPVSGTNTPTIVIEVGKAGTGGAGNFFYSTPPYGIKFINGIYILGSTTDFNGSTFTALSSNKMFFDVQFAYENGITNPA